MAQAAQRGGGRSAPGAALAALPVEMIERILIHVEELRDLAAANAAARLFRGAPLERALRERARARGHEDALPVALSEGVFSWTEELFVREAVLTLAHSHACVAACAGRDEDTLEFFSAFVDAEGGLLTCGDTDMCMIAARLDDPPPTPSVLGHAAAVPGPVKVPTRVASLSATRVRAVAAGLEHLLALSDAGAVYGCGGNRGGQLGLGDMAERGSFVIVGGPLAADDTVGIAAGAYASLALSATGRVHSWGSNDFGQLGHADGMDRCEPTRIETLAGVRVGGMSVGEHHTLLLSTAGGVYACGEGEDGQLGHGDRQYQRTPRRIEALAGVRAVHVSAGDRHSLVVDAAGGMYHFGNTRQSASARSIKAADARDACVQLVPRRIEWVGWRAARTAAGMHGSCVVIGDDGTVRTFGCHLCWNFGEDMEWMPMVFPAHGRVVDVAIDETHALFTMADGGVYSCGQQWAVAALGRETTRPDPDDADGTISTTASTLRIGGLQLRVGDRV